MARKARIVLVGVVAFVVALSVAGAWAQNNAALPNVRVVLVPVQNTDSLDGATLYTAYCASCHGKDLKGFGPAWRFTPAPPVDLTKCAAGHATPDARVMHIEATIHVAHLAASHPEPGRPVLDMPDWVTVFRSTSPGNDVGATLRVHNLATYIASRQAATPAASVQAAK